VSGELSDAPEPTTDPDPDRSPGGPADRVDADPDSFGTATPDQPRSAQVEEDVVPDEIEEGEAAAGDDEDDVDPEDEAPV
jgi:hypothetical protein